MKPKKEINPCEVTRILREAIAEKIPVENLSGLNWNDYGVRSFHAILKPIIYLNVILDPYARGVFSQ